MGAHHATKLSGEDEQAVRRVVAAYETAWNRHDMKALGVLFTPDADWINIVGMHWTGQDEVQKAHEVYHRRMFATTDIRSTRVEVRGIGAGVAVAVVDLAVGDFKTPTGQEIKESRDRLSLTLVKRDGRWEIVHGHNTVIDPAAAPYDPIRGEKMREVGAP
jgi:uncharacterized protein (TIGR02246 family)